GERRREQKREAEKRRARGEQADRVHERLTGRVALADGGREQRQQQRRQDREREQFREPEERAHAAQVPARDRQRQREERRALRQQSAAAEERRHDRPGLRQALAEPLREDVAAVGAHQLRRLANLPHEQRVRVSRWNGWHQLHQLRIDENGPARRAEQDAEPDQKPPPRLDPRLMPEHRYSSAATDSRKM